MALAAAKQPVRLREVVLKDKPPSLLEFSPKATVPVLVLKDGRVIDESLAIMQWALEQSDQERLLSPSNGDFAAMLSLIDRNDSEFKTHLDRYKYSTRYEGADPMQHRTEAERFIDDLNERLCDQDYLFGNRASLADIAIAPFVRQFANADTKWFESTRYENVHRWLREFLESPRFRDCMHKFKQWKTGDAPIRFPLA